VTHAEHPILGQTAIDQWVDYALIPCVGILRGFPASLDIRANDGSTLRGDDDVRVARVVTTCACIPFRQRLLGRVILIH